MKKLILILVISNITLFWYILSNLIEKSFVAFLDVGQGSSVLIYNHKFQILYDAGPPGFKVINKLNKYMPFYDKYIDVVIISHPDKDHYGGLFSIIERYKLGLVIINPQIVSESTYQKLIKKLIEREIPIIALKQGDKIITDKEELYILNPPNQLFKTDNQNSLVIKMIKNNKNFLLSGDIDHKVEKYLIKKFGQNLTVDYFLVPHHGSRYSSSDEFLSFLQYLSDPFGIIQVGDNNYGHPHKETLFRLNKLGISYWRTDLNGDFLIY